MNMGIFEVDTKTIQIIPLTQFDRIVYTVIWGSYSLNDLMYHCTTPLDFIWSIDFPIQALPSTKIMVLPGQIYATYNIFYV